jgi:hypothetical protein
MFIDVLPSFSVAMGRHIHEQVPGLTDLVDAEAIEATRGACEGNMREIFSMLRAGLPATAHVTPVQGLEWARFLRLRGATYRSVIGSYEYGLAMFLDVLGLELEARVQDPARRAAIAQWGADFLFTFVARMLERLLYEFGLIEGAWHPAATDPVLANPASAEAARRYRDEQIACGQWLPPTPEQSTAHAFSERVLEAFALTVEHITEYPELARRLAAANTTVTVTLADEPDVSVTLLLDRTPIEVLEGRRDAEVHLSVASVDLDHIWSVDFQLGMAIVRGRVRVSGPVRKFLRVLPILRPLAATYRELTAGHAALAGTPSPERSPGS